MLLGHDSLILIVRHMGYMLEAPYQASIHVALFNVPIV